MVEGYIPRATIKEYGADEFGLSGDELEFFISVIRKLDISHLSGAAPSRSDGKMRDEVNIKDAAGVRGLLSRLAAAPGDGDRFRKHRAVKKDKYSKRVNARK